MTSTRLRRIFSILLILSVVGQVLYFPNTDYFFVAEELIPHELGGM